MRIFSATIMLFAIFSVCAEEKSPQGMQRGNEWMISLTSFTGEVSPENQKGIPESFFIKKNEKEIAAFIQKADMLKIGMSEQEVLGLLGRPASIQKSGPKRENKITTVSWKYYLMKKDDHGVNERYDAYLMLVFSPEKMILTKIIFSKGYAYI